METLEPNGGGGRSKPKRKTLASALVKPQTLNVLLALMPRLIKLIAAILELERAFRN